MTDITVSTSPILIYCFPGCQLALLPWLVAVVAAVVAWQDCLPYSDLPLQQPWPPSVAAVAFAASVVAAVLASVASLAAAAVAEVVDPVEVVELPAGVGLAVAEAVQVAVVVAAGSDRASAVAEAGPVPAAVVVVVVVVVVAAEPASWHFAVVGQRIGPALQHSSALASACH